MKDFAKGVPRWVRGVFAKKSEISDEFIVLTPAGAHTFRTVRRLPGDQRHNVECLESTAGLPWPPRMPSSVVQNLEVDALLHKYPPPKSRSDKCSPDCT